MITNYHRIDEIDIYKGFKIIKVTYNNVRYQGKKDNKELWAGSLEELKEMINNELRS